MPPTTRKRPLVLLFDIGGVCVVSPFQAILDYEAAHNIPSGFINWSISQTNPHGAWQRLERGELVCDENFYSAWKSDLQDEKRWRTYYAKNLARERGQKPSDAAEETAYAVSPPPEIDAEALHNEMMGMARALDPHMGPALRILRKRADEGKGQLILGALSNTAIFPRGHPLFDDTTSDGKQNRGLDGIFDVFVSSAHIGMRKPDEEAYRYALVRLHEFAKTKFVGAHGVRAEDVVFLDDIGTNLKTARRLGMRTVKVTLGRVEEAVRELEKVVGFDLGSSKARL